VCRECEWGRRMEGRVVQEWVEGPSACGAPDANLTTGATL